MAFESKKQNTPTKIGQQFGLDLMDVTLLSTPRPQASSTVERKTFATAKFPQALSRNAPCNNSNIFEQSAESSLGLVNNISNLLEEHDKSIQESSSMIVNKIETERELTRQIIQSCGEGSKLSSGLEVNKENNVNLQNLLAIPSDASTALSAALSKLSINNVSFEPTEFAARSSVMRASNEYNQDDESSKCNIDGFSFNSAAAEMMAKFTDDDFIPASCMSRQLSADELSCRQNFNAIPTAVASEKERLEFSCFSGIMGDVDLSIESHTGRRVSAGEFFGRKCGPLGTLSDGPSTNRPSFGIMELKSPERTSKGRPLVNITATTTDVSSASILDSSLNDESNILSLSKIAQALQTVDGTPGRLVDQLLMVNKNQKFKKPLTKNSTGDTYTLSTARSSLPVIASMSPEKSEQHSIHSVKLSLDSKTITDSIADKMKSIKESISLDEKDSTMKNPIEQSMKQVEINDQNDNLKKETRSPISRIVKKEQNSPIATSRFNEKIFISKNTQELYKCIIGVSREADIEIQNESERWLRCTLNLLQIQGDKNNVEINVPTDEFLIEPGKSQIVKLFVKFEKMGDPIIAALAVGITDMSTREIFTKQHMMCFVPENPKKTDFYPPTNSVKDSRATDENHKDALRSDTPQTFTSLGEYSSPTSQYSRTSSLATSGRNSPRSTTSSAGTVAGDSIPIKSTHSSLVWTSVRVGKHETREFIIRNTSNNKIKLQGIITDNDNSFKFLKDRESSTTITIGLQHMESKTFAVGFSPHNIGAAAGKITFMHYEKKRESKESRPSRIIPLYGYGGHGKVCISQALKIIGDQMWLSLGKLSVSGSLNTRIKLENTGDLSAYAKISLAPKAVYPSVEMNWHVEPTELILGPKEVQWVTVKFRPRKEDISLLRGDVADMGTLIITHGDEPTRWRIRRLYKKMCEAGQIKKNEEEDIFRNVVYPLCKVFPGETVMPHNLNIIRDSLQDLGVLCRRVNRHVITLTMELSGDDTISIFHDDDDDFNESQMFQSLYSDATAVLVTNENSYMPQESLTNNIAGMIDRYGHEFVVSPGAVTLSPPSEKDTTIVITSSSSTAQPFETTLSNPDFLSVIPSEGMIPAGGVVRIKIQCKKRIDKQLDAVLQIYTTNEKRDVIIKIRPG